MSGHGLSVEHWDAGALVYELKRGASSHGPNGPWRTKQVLSCRNDLRRLAAGLCKNDVVIYNINATVQNQWMLDLLTLTGAVTVFLCPGGWSAEGVFGSGDLLKQMLERIRYGLARAQPGKLWNLLYWKLPSAIRRVKGFRIVVQAGRVPCVPHLTSTDTLLVPSHSWEYEMAFFEKADQLDLPDRYAVFIDQNVPFHPDQQIAGRVKAIDPMTYFAELKALFRDFTEKTGLEVVVAAHPTADCDRYQEIWHGYKIFFGSTRELMRRAELAIVHDSNAIAFAAIFNTPLLFVTSDLFKGTYHDHYISAAAERFGGISINISNRSALAALSHYIVRDKELFCRYISIAVKASDAPSTSKWGTIFDAIQIARGNCTQAEQGAN